MCFCCLLFMLFLLGLLRILGQGRQGIIALLLFYYCEGKKSITKSTYRRKQLNRISQFYRVVELMAIMVGSRSVGGQAGHWNSSREFTC